MTDPNGGPGLAERARVLIEELEATYPQLFNHDAPKPLAIGVHRDIQSRHPGHSWRLIKTALGRWVRRPAYLKALEAGGARYGLDGQPRGEVTPKQAAEFRPGVKLKKRKKPAAPPAKVEKEASATESGKVLVAGKPRPVLGAPSTSKRNRKPGSERSPSRGA